VVKDLVNSTVTQQRKAVNRWLLLILFVLFIGSIVLSEAIDLYRVDDLYVNRAVGVISIFALLLIWSISKMVSNTRYNMIYGERSFSLNSASKRIERSSDPVDSSIGRIDNLAELYDGYVVQSHIMQLSTDVKQLLNRLKGKGNDNQVKLVSARYVQVLSKVELLINPNYLKDLLDNPQYWPDAETRIDQVTNVLVAVQNQAVQNIRQVNAGGDLDLETH